MEAQDNAPMGESISTNPSDNAGSIGLLKNISYEQAGTYEYIIKEQIPETKRTGMTYDESIYKVIVTVTDDLNGNLKATSKIEKSSDGGTNYTDANSIEFKNSYEPLSATMTPLAVTKVLSGDRNNGLNAGEFSFEISTNSKDGIILPANKVVTNDANGKVQFENIIFTKAGTYVVSIKEVVPDNNKVDGVTYDEHTIESTFNVTDREGQLVVTRSNTTGSQTFENVYNTTGNVDGATNLKVTKVLEGRGWQAGDSFSFVLSGNDDTTNTAIENEDIILPDNAKGITITNEDETKSAAFGDITIKKPGTYMFTISEDASKPINGITYADAKVITVTATDNGNGTLNVTVSGNTDLTFVNTYTPNEATLNGEANLKVTKVIDGRDWLATDKFSFKLESGDNNTELAIENSIVKMPGRTLVINNGNKNTASFDDITFTKAGTYKFKISEVEEVKEEDKISGIKYDTTPKIITVEVVDNKDGTMSATIVANESDDLTFTNKYTPDSAIVGATNLAVSKTLTGREWNDTDVFTFSIEAVDSTTKNAVDTKEIILENPETSINKNTALHTAAFGNITFTKPGNYQFKVTEKKGNIKGITYDPSEKYVNVSVTDDNNGKLVAKVNGEDHAVLTFENTYAPVDPAVLSGETYLKVTKNLTGRANNEWLTRDIYIFDLKPDTTDTATAEAYNNGNIILGDNSLIVNRGTGTDAYFGDITFKTAGTYKFTVSEVNTEYDPIPTRPIVVNVTDNLDGTLSAALDTEKSQSLEFNNVYKPSEAVLEGNTELKVTKNFTGRDWLGSEFTFNLAAGNTTTQEAITAEKVILSNDSLTINEGNIDSASFGNITFKEAGTYEFIVSEKEGNIPGVTYDTAPRKIIVNVVDNNYGELVATIDKGSKALTFNNSYAPDATTLVGSENLRVTKTFTGRAGNAWLETDEFKFVIKAAADDFATIEAVENGEIILPGDLVINSTNKDSASFGDITFTKAGTYKFTISEEEGKIPGVTYDKTSKNITVNVVDKNDGTMEATLVEGSGALAFNNTYAPEPVLLEGKNNLQVTKNFTGRAGD